MARRLGTTRRNLDHWLTSQGPLPESILLGVINQMRTHIESQRSEIEELDLRMTKLRRQLMTSAKPNWEGRKANSGTAFQAFRAQLHVVDRSATNASG